MKKIELLAPAGTIEKAKIAIKFGADAIYLGVPKYSLRSRINDFDWKKIKEIIDFAHQEKKKVYLTFNIYAHNRHFKTLVSDFKKVSQIKPDAIIVSDPGILEVAKNNLENKIKIFLSTQANCTNSQAAKYWYKQGVSRIILAREVSLTEINEIKKAVPKLELEYFLHGAMCMSYSGRCILSSWFNNRSANLGDCTQPCRWQYYLTERVRKEEGKIEYIPIEEDENGTYILNSKDFCAINQIEEMQKAGICSFKIEGRTKSAYYVGNIVKIYRQAIDLIEKGASGRKEKLKKLEKDLKKLSNREFTTGFLFPNEKYKMQKYDRAYEKVNYEFVGQVLESKKEKGQYRTTVLVHNVIKPNITLEAIPPKEDNFKFKINKMFDYNKKEQIKQAHGGQKKKIYFYSDKKIEIDTLLRRKL